MSDEISDTDPDLTRKGQAAREKYNQARKGGDFAAASYWGNQLAIIGMIGRQRAEKRRREALAISRS